jgi:hypothetical protein
LAGDAKGNCATATSAFSKIRFIHGLLQIQGFRLQYDCSEISAVIDPVPAKAGIFIRLHAPHLEFPAPCFPAHPPTPLSRESGNLLKALQNL